MAEQSQAAAVETPESEVKVPETKWDDSIAFSRFLMIKSFEPGYVAQEKFTANNIYNASFGIERLEQLIKDTNPTLVISFLKQAVDSNYSTSLDAALWCLALCFRKSESVELKKLLRENFNVLVKTSDDLLAFAYYFSAQEDHKLNFGSAMRGALNSWYDSRSPSELLELIFATQSINIVRHVDIIRQLHPKFENEDKNVIVQAMHKSYEELKEAAATSNTLKKILKYRDLKRCKEVHEVLSILKRKDFAYKLNHLPSNALNSAEALELILPNMTLVEVLDKVIYFADKKMLKAKDSVSRKICNALQASDKAIIGSKLDPLHVFSIMKELEEKLTFTTEAGEKKVANPFVIKKLEQIFQNSLENVMTIRGKESACRFYVTLNFRKYSKRQSKVGSMSCIEAQVIFTLALLRVAAVTVMTFTGDRNKLKPVNWNAATSLEKALEDVQKEIKVTPKTKENISFPLKKANEDRRKVDVFITFVSSIARTRGKNAKPPLEDLQDYRKSMDIKTSRLVVVNLARKSTDFVYTKRDESETGILEIVGFNPESRRIIEAFSENSFV